MEGTQPEERQGKELHSRDGTLPSEQDGGQFEQLQARARQSPGATENSTPPDAQNGVASPSVSEREGNGEPGVAGRGGRTPAITSKEWAGSVVWARLAKFPWWPAQVLDESDPWIPNDSEPPRHGAIPVRFFGTYDFAWIESHRAICPYDKGHAEHSKQSRQKVFVQAMQEAENFQETNDLPSGFYEDSPPSPQPLQPTKKSRPASGKARSKRPGSLNAKGQKRDGTAISRRSVRERQDAILRHLALQPPPDSPYVHKLNLDGVRKLLELKKAGLYPPAPPKPVPVQATQPAAPQIAFTASTHRPQAQASASTSVVQPSQAVASSVTYAPSLMQMSGSLVAQSQAPTSHMQQYTQLLQQQQLLQQHFQGQTGQTPWFMQPHLYGAQLGFGYFSGQQGGVQGALMAAANQQHAYTQRSLETKPQEASNKSAYAQPQPKAQEASQPE